MDRPRYCCCSTRRGDLPYWCSLLRGMQGGAAIVYTTVQVLGTMDGHIEGPLTIIRHPLLSAETASSCRCSAFVWLLSILAASIVWVAIPPLQVGADEQCRHQRSLCVAGNGAWCCLDTPSHDVTCAVMVLLILLLATTTQLLSVPGTRRHF